MLRRRLVSVVAALTLLTSCGDGGPAFLPFFLFNYAGVLAGTFDAKGNPPQNETPQNWATAIRDPETGMIIALAQVIREDGNSDVALIAFPDDASGSINFDQNCDPETTACTGLAIIFGINGTESEICELTSGALVITKNTADRVAGTFTGSAQCLDDNAADLGVITITGGSFELTFTTGTF